MPPFRQQIVNDSSPKQLLADASERFDVLLHKNSDDKALHQMLAHLRKRTDTLEDEVMNVDQVLREKQDNLMKCQNEFIRVKSGRLMQVR